MRGRLKLRERQECEKVGPGVDHVVKDMKHSRAFPGQYCFYAHKQIKSEANASLATAGSVENGCGLP
jgi:hypothetical protein